MVINLLPIIDVPHGDSNSSCRYKNDIERRFSNELLEQIYHTLGCF